MSNVPHIVIASPIRQSPEILGHFLNSLELLDTNNLSVEYLFADDNDVHESREKLKKFIERCNQPARVNPVNGVRVEYRKNNVGHQWTTSLMNRVGAIKDEFIQYVLDTNATHLLLVDSDLLLHPLTLQQLVALDLPIVSEIFWTKWRPDAQEFPQVWLGGQYRLYRQFPGEKLTPEQQWTRTQEVLAELRMPGVYEVGGLGALTLLRRDALERGIRFAPIKNLDLTGEDRHLCVRAAALDIPLHVDTHYPALHLYRWEDMNRVPDYLHRSRIEHRIAYSIRCFLDDLFMSGANKDSYDPRFATDELRSVIRDLREQWSDSDSSPVSIEKPLVHSVVVHSRSEDHGLARFTLVNHGSEGGERFRDHFDGEANIVFQSGEWLVSDVWFYPTPPRDPFSLLEADSQATSNNVRTFYTFSSRPTITLTMIVHNEGGRYLRRVLEAASQVIDKAVIIDDASTDDSIDVCRECLRGIDLTVVRNDRSRFRNEVELRTQQWKETIATNPDWILNLDADELLENKALESLPKLACSVKQHVILFRLFDFWTPTHFREDEWWRAHLSYRPFMCRYVPTFQYVWKNTPIHCGRFPANILDLPYFISDLRIKHLGWIDKSDRIRKYERYKQLDPDAKYGIREQYESILDPNPRLIEWKD